MPDAREITTGQTSAGEGPDGLTITRLSNRSIEVTGPEGLRYRLWLPDVSDVAAVCEDSDRCEIPVTASHLH